MVIGIRRPEPEVGNRTIHSAELNDTRRFGKIERDMAGSLVCAGLWQDNGV